MVVPTNFVPAVANITAITQGKLTTLITTATVNGFMPGLYVKIYIPYPNSMPEITGKSYPITIISNNSFTIPVNSINFTPFALSATQQAQAVPTGESDTLVNAVNNNLNN